MQDGAAAKEAASLLKKSDIARGERRSLLKGAVVGTSTLALFGVSASSVLAQAQEPAHAQDVVAVMLSAARTAKQLAVTFYSNGIANADKLGLRDADLVSIKAALVEEQIHLQFFAASGGESMGTTFSFPKGRQTFEDLETFIATQQQLEGVFGSAFLASIKEFASVGRADFAQIAAQVACVEAEHRVLGRIIARLQPANNWAFTPIFLARVSDAAALVKDAGYLSPVAGNSYTYQAVTTDYPGIGQRKPFAAQMQTTEGKG